MASAGQNHLYRLFGERLRQRRRSRRPALTQQKLADAVGLSRTSLANIERGHQRVQIHLLYQFARVLQCKPLELLPSFDSTSSDGQRLSLDILKHFRPEEQSGVAQIVKS